MILSGKYVRIFSSFGSLLGITCKDQHFVRILPWKNSKIEYTYRIPKDRKDKMEAILEKLKVRNFPSTKYKDGIRIQLPIQDVRKERDIDRYVVLDRIQRQTVRGKVEVEAPVRELPIEREVPKTKKITKIVLEAPGLVEAEVPIGEKQAISEVPIGEKEGEIAEEEELPKPKTVVLTRKVTRKVQPTTTMDVHAYSEGRPKGVQWTMIQRPPPEILTMKTSPYYLNNRKLFLQKINQLFEPYMKELADTEEEITCGKLKAMGAAGDKFQLLLHQRVAREYLNLLSPYRGFLLLHSLGSGKSCTSIAIAEGMKSHRKIVLLTPASLKMNYFTELKRCGDPLYKKNQHWSFVSTEGRPDLQESLARSMSLSMEFIQKKSGVWVAEANKPANFADITDDQQTQVDDQLNQMIRAKYTDIHYNAPNLRKIIAEMSQNYTKNPFDNAVIIIDEAHNLVNRIVNKLSKMSKNPKKVLQLGEKTPVSIVLYEYLMSASNARIVLLSGTPIINTPSEVGVLYNMLRGYIKTWTYSLRVTTQQKITTDTIRNMFHRENFETMDYMEYNQNKLTITRNPYGFVNNMTGVCLPKKQPKKVMISRPRNVTTKVTTTVKPSETTFPTGGGANRRTKKNRRSGSEISEEGFVDEEEEVDDTNNLDRKYVIPTYLQHTGDDEPHMGGATGDDSVDPRYKGVCLDETGNVSDKDFAFKVRDILNKNGLEVVGSPQIDLNKCLPDRTDAFLEMFVDTDSDTIKNPDLFVRRILGLTSFFKSAQETLLPSFVKTADGEVYNVIRADMSEHQFEDYASIRKEEYEKEKDMQKKKKKQGPGPGQGEEELYKEFTSTYRIYSRAACNFSWPQPPDRPIQPVKKAKGKKEEVAVPNVESSLVVRDQRSRTGTEGPLIQLTTESTEGAHSRLVEGGGDDDEEEEIKIVGEDDEEDEIIGGDEAEVEEIELDDLGDEVNEDDAISAQDNIDIASAMQTLNDPQFLAEAKLGSYSPKFAAILERILDEKNVGLHLLYSSFRTLEGIGILRLILLQNGFAEFKLVKTSDGEWAMDEGKEGADAGKPRFALYTGTETAEEKEIVRNVYNGAWDMVPPNIAKKLEERDPDGKKNVMGAVIKVLMITASGAEGINLKNTRYVHIVEPYWNMVRVDQVVGRARRICSHEELPPELRTVEVFIYLSVFSEKQKTDRNYIDLMNQDTSRFDETIPVTTDETMYEISVQKNKINQRILEVVKQSSVDCALYNPSGKSGLNQVCYGANMKNVTTNDFISYPSIELDSQVQEKTVVQRTKMAYREVTMKGEKYHLNETTQEIYDHSTFMRAKKTGETMVPLGKLVKEGRGYKIVK